MLHTKFHGNLSTGSGDVDLKLFFFHIWACDPDALNTISFPLPKEAQHKIWL